MLDPIDLLRYGGLAWDIEAYLDEQQDIESACASEEAEFSSGNPENCGG